MKKDVTDTGKNAPLYPLEAFHHKATWTDFYIQTIKDHIKEHPFIDVPHKHDFYLVLYVEKGQGTHTIDFTQYLVEENSIFLMTPGQVHSWALSRDIKGYVLFFTREFYQSQLSQNNLLEFPFYHSLAANPFVRLVKNDVTGFTLRQMYEEYNHSDNLDLRILRTYLDLLLLESAKYYNPGMQTITQGKNSANTFKLRKLEQLIDENFKVLKQPSEYGEKMNLATNYLNSICKESLGKTLTELIQERVLLEAKRMFAYSDLNVNEVATALSFTDSSYFVRWFKKLQRVTPEEFRKSIR